MSGQAMPRPWHLYAKVARFASRGQAASAVAALLDRPRRGKPCRYRLAQSKLRRKTMPVTHVRGININYEVLGTGGPWVALSPGGRRALDNVKSLAQHVADAGYRVLIHDRRNCGLSDIAIGAEASEYEVWAHALYHLLPHLKALPPVAAPRSPPSPP